MDVLRPLRRSSTLISGGRPRVTAFAVAAGAFVAWVVLVGGWTVATARMLAVLAAASVSAWTAAAVTRRYPATVPAIVAVTPALLLVIGRGTLPLGYPNAGAALLFVGAAAAIMAATRIRSQAAHFAAAALLIAYSGICWAVDARAAGITTLALGATVVLVRSEPARRVLMVTAVGGLAVAVSSTVLLGASYAPFQRDAPLDRLIDVTISENRVQLWSEALDIAGERPVAGVGIGNFAQASATARANPDLAWAHSAYLQLAAETGATGAALALVAVTALLLALLRAPLARDSLISGVVVAGLAVNASVDYILQFPILVIAAGAVVASGAVRSEATSVAPERPGSIRPLSAVVVATAFVAAAMLVPWGPANPPHRSTNGVQILTDGAAQFESPGVLKTDRPLSRQLSEVATSEAFSLELRAAAANAYQFGPARIVGMSVDYLHRNFTVGQWGPHLVVRFRTNSTDLNGTDHALWVENVFSTTVSRHLVVTADGGTTAIYVDGRLRAMQSHPDATLASWNRGYPLVVGNEVGGKRAWIGTVEGVRISSVPLTAGDVRERYEGGRLDGPTQPQQRGSAIYLGPPGTVRGNHPAAGPPPPPLRSPPTVESPPDGLWTDFWDVGQYLPLFGPWTGVVGAWSARYLGVVHLGVVMLLGALWGAVAVGSSEQTTSVWRSWPLVAGAAMAGLLTIELLQFAEGRSASVLDVSAGLVGVGLGAAWSLRRRPLRLRRRKEVAETSTPRPGNDAATSPAPAGRRP